jgi:nucleotide-binding universal stress UspA family protein
VNTNGAPRATVDTSIGTMRALVAVDGSAPAIRACQMLTHLLPAGAEIRLLTVLSYSDYPYSLVGGRLSDEDERRDESSREVAAAQWEAREILEKAGYRVTVVHRFGYPSDEIISELDEHGADIVVLGTRKLHGPARWVGSTSDRVIHQARVPVLLVA